MADTKHETLSGAAQSTMHGAAHGVGVHDVSPKDVGGAPTAPGQTEVVAGTVEHQQVLKAYPNATSYAGDVNVVLPPEEEPPPDPPPDTLSGAAATQHTTKADTKHDTKSSTTKGSSY